MEKLKTILTFLMKVIDFIEFIQKSIEYYN
jgi:hypothetical protein